MTTVPHDRNWVRALRWAFTTAVVAWALALPLAPLAASSRSIGMTAHAAAAVTYAAGSLVCHQQAGRSFHLAGVQLPVCGRCTGIYAGAALATIFVAASARRRGGGFDLERARAWMLASTVPIALTLALEWTTGARPSNLVRALSGAPLGAAVGWVILRSLRSPAGLTIDA